MKKKQRDTHKHIVTAWFTIVIVPMETPPLNKHPFPESARLDEHITRWIRRGGGIGKIIKMKESDTSLPVLLHLSNRVRLASAACLFIFLRLVATTISFKLFTTFLLITSLFINRWLSRIDRLTIASERIWISVERLDRGADYMRILTAFMDVMIGPFGPFFCRQRIPLANEHGHGTQLDDTFYINVCIQSRS